MKPEKRKYIETVFKSFLLRIHSFTKTVTPLHFKQINNFILEQQYIFKVKYKLSNIKIIKIIFIKLLKNDKGFWQRRDKK